NSELKAQAMEKAHQEQSAQEGQGPEAAGGVNAARAPGGRPGGGGQRTPRRRSLEGTPAPRFEPRPGQAKAYLLRPPSDSVRRLGPSGFRPTIRLEGKYIAIAVSADAAESAL